MPQITKEALIAQIKDGIIVSCQALPHEPLYTEAGGVIPLLVKAAEQGGAVGIRANSVRDIKEIKEVTKLPIIGIIKRDYDDADVFITATMKEIDELMTVKPEIIALDATTSTRPNGQTLDDFYHEIRAKYPDQLLMADCSTVDEMIHADELGFDFIGSALVGYTKQSKGDKIEENDFEILRTVLERIKHPLIAEGNIDTPEKVKRVLELGAYSVVVGSAITRPQLITKKFVDAIQQVGKD